MHGLVDLELEEHLFKAPSILEELMQLSLDCLAPAIEPFVV